MTKNARTLRHSAPTIGAREIAAASRAIRSGFLGRGQETAAFEREFASFIGVKHAVAVSSGSSALHLALAAVGAANGEVVMPSYACSALLNASHMAGCVPKLADLDRDSFNSGPSSAKAVVTRRTKAIVAVHMFGEANDIAGFRRFGLPVIEDCAMSLGASANRRMLGSSGDVSVASFYATKMICTGFGGVVFTDSARIAATVRDLVDYDNRDDYRPRYNYLMGDLQSAIGRVQLRSLHGFVRERRLIARLYSRALAKAPVVLPMTTDGNCFHRFVIRAGKDDIAGLRSFLKKSGIEAKSPVFRPLHRYLKLPANSFKNTEEAHLTALSLPIYPSLGSASARRVAEAVNGYFGIR